ncbi:MAG: redoxin domain-containing protein, partial [Tepidiformaceae bacterium]
MTKITNAAPMSKDPLPTPPEVTPDERPQRRREYSGAGSTLGLAALIILTVGVAIWWFEFRGDGSGSAGDDGFGVVQLATSDNPTGKPPAAEAGRAAPNFHLRDLDDGAASLTDYRGKWVLVNFWASWCGPCRSEVPDLQELTQRRPDDIVILGVNQQETRDAAAKFTEEFDVTYPIVLDRSGEVSQAYRARGLPVSYLVNPEGVIVKVYLGRVTDEDVAA